MVENIVILMTACVFPNDTKGTALQAPSIRKKQYLDAIDFYLRETPLKIVFCENSGTNLWDEIVSKGKNTRLEYLSFNCEGYRNKGKGFGEAKIIQYAISNSQFIKDASFIIKITGRIIVKNINKLYLSTPKKTQNTIIISFYSGFGLPLSSVCFLAHKAWFQKIMERYGSQISDGYATNFEDILFKAIIEDSTNNILRFNPILEGTCAGLNAPYKNTIDLQHKCIHFSKLYRIYKLRKDNYHCFIYWIVWRWYAIRIIVHNIFFRQD